VLYPLLTGHRKQINKVAKQYATNGVLGPGNETAGVGDCPAEMRKRWMREHICSDPDAIGRNC